MPDPAVIEVVVAASPAVVEVVVAASPAAVEVIAAGPQGPAGSPHLRVTTIVTGEEIAPDLDTTDLVDVTGLASSLSISPPVGTARDGHRLVFRLRDDGTARALSWAAGYASGGPALPAVTAAGKLMHLGFLRDAAGVWYLVATSTQP